MITPKEQRMLLKKAQALVQRMRQSVTRHNTELTKGVNSNEFKTIYKCFIKLGSISKIKTLLHLLSIDNSFSHSKKTKFYYKHIKQALESEGFFKKEYSFEELRFILGWSARILPESKKNDSGKRRR